jgi:hypothetical protein
MTDEIQRLRADRDAAVYAALDAYDAARVARDAALDAYDAAGVAWDAYDAHAAAIAAQEKENDQ